MRKVVVTPEFLNLESPHLARATLLHIIEHADIVGRDRRGRHVMRFEFACDPWMMEKLASYGADEEDLEEDPESYPE